jgi:hypothetical protein
MHRWNNELDVGDDLNALLHPSQAFEHPTDVVKDPDLTLNEKRSILASWASDACAVEAVPSLRCPPGAKRPVRFDEVMDALRALDSQATEQGDPCARYRRIVGRSRNPVSRRGTPDKGQGHSLN